MKILENPGLNKVRKVTLICVLGNIYIWSQDLDKPIRLGFHTFSVII